MATTSSIWMVATIATAGACTNTDDDVVPDVLRADLTARQNAPNDLAIVGMSVELTAGSRADRTIELWDVWLLEPTKDESDHRLKLALPGGSLDFAPDEQKVVDLVNVGTTNADLIPLCGVAIDVLLNVRYLDDPKMNGFADVDFLRTTVVCI